MTNEDSAAERKRKRLEEWKRRRQQAAPAPSPLPPPAVKVSLSFNNVSSKPVKKQKITPLVTKPINPFGSVDDDDHDDDSEDDAPKGKLSLGLGFSLTDTNNPPEERPRRRGRWDSKEKNASSSSSSYPKPTEEPSAALGDSLEKFMDKLQAGALGSVVTQVSEVTGTEMLSIDVGGSMMRVPKLKQAIAPLPPPTISGGVITPEELAKLSSSASSKPKDPDSLYTPSDWESDDHQGGATSEVSTCTISPCLNICIFGQYDFSL